MIEIQFRALLMLAAMTSCILCSASSLKRGNLNHKSTRLHPHKGSSRSINILDWTSCDESEPQIFSISNAWFQGDLNTVDSPVSLELTGSSRSGFTVGQTRSIMKYSIVTLVDQVHREVPAKEFVEGKFSYAISLNIPTDAPVGRYKLKVNFFDSQLEPSDCFVLTTTIA